MPKLSIIFIFFAGAPGVRKFRKNPQPPPRGRYCTSIFPELLKPLLEDLSPQVQQCAAIALGRLAHQDPSAGEEMLHGNMLQKLFSDMDSRNKYYRRSAMFVLRAVCKFNEDTSSDALLTAGGIEALMNCLCDPDPEVKEAAAWAAGYAARHGHTLAKALVDAGCIPQLAMCLQEREVTVKRVAASAVADIARHGSDLAQAVVDAGCVMLLAKSSSSKDDRLRRQALIALSSIARHQQTLAESVTQTDILGSTLIAMGHSCSLVRRNAAMLVRDICKHSPELSQLVANAGGIGALVAAVKDNMIEVRIPAITALGYIAGHAQQLTGCVITCDGTATLAQQLLSEENASQNELLCITVWALAQMARHCAQPVAEYPGVLARLLFLYTTSQEAVLRASDKVPRSRGSESSNETAFGLPFDEKVGHCVELRARCKAALRQCVQGCYTLAALEPLLSPDCPTELLKHVLGQFAKVSHPLAGSARA